jgi:hypothetical protein
LLLVVALLLMGCRYTVNRVMGNDLFFSFLIPSSETFL